MLYAIHKLRSDGVRVAALTNNFATPMASTSATADAAPQAGLPASLAAMFDVVIESWKVGATKPPIYDIT